jgi:hypothetical protein
MTTSAQVPDEGELQLGTVTLPVGRWLRRRNHQRPHLVLLVGLTQKRPGRPHTKRAGPQRAN